MGISPEPDFQAQAQRWRLHVLQTPLAVIEWDLAGRVQSWNPAAERMFGYPAAEAIGQPIIELIVPPQAEVRDQVHHIADGLTREGQPSHAEHENRRKDGTLILCRWFNTPLTDEAGQPLGVASMALDVTELQRTTQALRESEQRFRTVADFTHDWEYWTAPDGSIPWMSPSCERVTGYPAEAFQRRPELIFQICHPEDRALVRNHAHGSTEHHEIAPMDFRIHHRDGRQLWISHICVQVQDSQGHSMGRRVANRDITERKREELSLQESEQRFRTIFEKGIDGIIMFTLEGELLDVNESFAQMHGRTREELRGLPITDLNTAETNALVPRRIARMLAGDTLKVELEQIHKDGHLFQTEATASQIYMAGQPAILSFHRNITERKQAEQALANSEARSRTMLQTAMDGIVLLDAEGRILDVNEAACRMHGYTREELLGLGIPDLQAKESLSDIRARIEWLRHNGSDLFETMHRKKDGTRFPVEVSVTQLPEQGQMLSFVRDITERREAAEENARLQAQLQQTQKMESLGTLAGGVAHDMNNVLGAILGLATANLEVQPPGSPAHRSFETIAKAATRGGEMVRSLLSFARQSRAEDREVDLNAILREETILLERTILSKVQLELDLEPGLRPIRGDAGALTHAIMNLCVNALDAMPEQGTLTLRTRNLDSRWVEVLVEDTGTGMPREVLERALDPFFTTKAVGKGTGLGLSMVYSTMKAHQGQLELHSEPGRGTRVRLRFPACEPAAKAGGQVEEAPSRDPSRSLTVLLVDDDELIQSSIQTLLQALGHAAFTASSGEESLLAIEGGLEPDVVILDMNMPGLGGSGTLPRLRVLLPEVPVLLSTGRTDQTALELAAAHPRVTLLPKPFSLKALEQCLESIWQGR